MTAPPGSWRPTPAFLRGAVVALGTLATAALARRPDVALLAVPFLGATTLGWLHRPTTPAAATLHVDARTLFEGQATTARVSVDVPDDGGAIVTVATLTAPEWIATSPRSGGRAVTGPTTAGARSPVGVDIGIRATRWGRHEIGVRHVACTSELGAFRTASLPTAPLRVEVLPLADHFDALDAVPRPAGLVGLHRSRHQGTGTELAEVRPFVTGDRLRRINWRVTSRTDRLHVNATWTDRDSEIVLLLDTEHDVGESTGIDGRASSLDIAMRATASVAEHYLRAGDRVRLIDLGRRVIEVRSAGGRAQLRRILDALVRTEVGPVRSPHPGRLAGVRPGALVIAMTPLLGRAGLATVAGLVQRGHSVIVIDTLPDDPFLDESPWRILAARVRLLERQVEIDELSDLGVPTVRWQGPGTLDEVLRDVARLAAAPRVGAGAR